MSCMVASWVLQYGLTIVASAPVVGVRIGLASDGLLEGDILWVLQLGPLLHLFSAWMAPMWLGIFVAERPVGRFGIHAALALLILLVGVSVMRLAQWPRDPHGDVVLVVVPFAALTGLVAALHWRLWDDAVLSHRFRRVCAGGAGLVFVVLVVFGCVERVLSNQRYSLDARDVVFLRSHDAVIFTSHGCPNWKALAPIVEETSHRRPELRLAVVNQVDASSRRLREKLNTRYKVPARVVDIVPIYFDSLGYHVAYDDIVRSLQQLEQSRDTAGRD
jgi:hypothetical protein